MSDQNNNSDNSKKTLEEILDAVDRGELKEADLEQYFELNEGVSNNLAPDYRLNPEKVETSITGDVSEDRGLGQVALNAANFLCKRARQREYSKRTWDAHNAQRPIIRVMAEGDSWFQYPFKLRDIIDHLNETRDDVAILCYSDAGDVLSNIVHKKEFLSGLKDQLPHYFLLSAGGNDLVDGAGISRFVLPFKEGREPKDYLRQEYQGFRNGIYGEYRSVCSLIRSTSPRTKILCHGYSLPVPKNGKWLGKPMEKLGIRDEDLQRQIVKVIIDDINKVIAQAISAFGSSADFLDVRGTVPDNGWYDEFHPKDEHYATVGEIFSRAIR